MATRYGLDDPGVESQLGEGGRFSATVHTGPADQPDSYTMGIGSFLGVKRPGRDVNHPIFRAKVKERVEL